MAKVYGYARISTHQQNIERQVRNILSEDKDAIIVRETYTGKIISRPDFEKLLKTVKPGDTLIFDSVSRMSRNAEEGFKLYKELYTQGVNLVFLKEHIIDTDTYKEQLEKSKKRFEVSTGDGATDKLVNTILDALNEYILSLAEKQIYLAFEQAQKEVDDLRQRTREGIETARRNGKRIGTPAGSVLNVKKREPIKELIKKHSKDFYGTLNDKQVIGVINSEGLSVSRNTYYKYKREIITE